MQVCAEHRPGQLWCIGPGTSKGACAPWGVGLGSPFASRLAAPVPRRGEGREQLGPVSDKWGVRMVPSQGQRSIQPSGPKCVLHSLPPPCLTLTPGAKLISPTSHVPQPTHSEKGQGRQAPEDPLGALLQGRSMWSRA